jgi:hypothetical protein
MRKLVITIVVLFSISFSYSQNISYGIRIGDNWSELQGNFGFKTLNDMTDYYKINKWYYGLYLNYSFNKMLAIQPELNYKTRGFQYHNSQGILGGSWGGNVKLNYIEIPFLFNCSYGNKLEVFMNVGPSLNVLVSGGEYDYFVWGSQDGITHNYTRNIRQDFNKTIIGVIGGIGLKYLVQPRLLLFSEFRTSYGITSATEIKEYTDENTSTTWYYGNSHFLDYSIDFGIAYVFKK